MAFDSENQRRRADDLRRYEQFVGLFAQTHDNLFAYVFSLLPRWSDAEDVFQQTSLILWRKFAEFQPGSDFLAWACRVAFFEVQNFRRAAGRQRLTFNNELIERLAAERDVGPQRVSLRREFLLECIERLSEKQRELLGRAYQGEGSIRQLAEQLKRSPQTIYNRLNQIRHLLFECVEDAMRRRRTEQ
ncbi:MAG: sigma-70 family RNA polymerase sigma factor [Pirellulales bacterium]|nr:sigma-70 family RNA polymerase sigma factor [Pirellulales bacterium]